MTIRRRAHALVSALTVLTAAGSADAAPLPEWPVGRPAADSRPSPPAEAAPQPTPEPSPEEPAARAAGGAEEASARPPSRSRRRPGERSRRASERASERAPIDAPRPRVSKARASALALLAGEEARSRRRTALERATAREAAGEGVAAARELALLAAHDDDPLLMIAAAELALAASSVRDPSPLSLARGQARATGAALARLDGAAKPADAWARAGLDRAQADDAAARAEAVLAGADARERSLRVARNGRGEMISGAVLTSIGVAGLGIMTGGLLLNRAAERELAAAGLDGVDQLPNGDRESFATQMDRASAMTAVGAVIGATGSALGVTLLAVGTRDLRRSGERRDQRASLRLMPSLTGVTVTGRF